MTKEDQAAFNEWAGGTYDSDYNEIDIWQAACAYKDKRITELEDLNTELTDTYNKHMQSWADKYNLLEALIVEAAEPIAILAKDERDAGRYELSRDLFKLVDRMEKYRPIQMPEGGGNNGQGELRP